MLVNDKCTKRLVMHGTRLGDVVWEVAQAAPGAPASPANIAHRRPFEAAWVHVRDFFHGTQVAEAREHATLLMKEDTPQDMKCHHFLAVLGMAGAGQWGRFRVEGGDDADSVTMYIEGFDICATVPWVALTRTTGFTPALARRDSFAAYIDHLATRSGFVRGDKSTDLAQHLAAHARALIAGARDDIAAG